MAIIEIQKTTNLDVTVTADPLHGYTFTNESEGHKFVITGTRSGSPITLAGVVTARFKRNNKTTVFIAGDKAKIENGKAVVTLLKDCYNVPGRFDFYVYVTSGGATTCVYYGTGTVIQTEEGTLIDSGEAVPSLEEFTEIVQNAQAATSEAENVNVTQTKSGNAITLTTTDRNGTTVSNILTDPSGIIASDFNASLAYGAGAYVIYTDGNLYRLTSDHEANVAWGDTGKTRVTIGEEVTNLKSALAYNTNPSINRNTSDYIPQWEQGNLTASGESASVNLIRTADYLEVPNGFTVSVEFDATLFDSRAVVFSAPSTEATKANFPFSDTIKDYTNTSGSTKYLRFRLGRLPTAAITPDIGYSAYVIKKHWDGQIETNIKNYYKNNLVDIYGVTEGKYWHYNNDKVQNNADWFLCKIPVSAGDKIFVHGLSASAVGGGVGYAIRNQDDNTTIVSGDEFDNWYITVPENGAWLYFSCAMTARNTLVLSVFNGEPKFESTQFPIPIVDMQELVYGIYINSNGEIAENTSYGLTGYLKIVGGQTYEVNVGTLYPNSRCGGFYDANKEFISICPSSTEAADGGKYTFVAPSNAEYVRLCGQRQNLALITCALVCPEFPEIPDAVKDIIIVGDSWSDMDTASTYTKWPAVFAQCFAGNIYNYARNGSKISGADNWALNGTVGGQVAAVLTDTSYETDDIGTVFIVGGINDYRANVAESTVLSAISSHVSRLRTRFPNARYICVFNHQLYVSKDQFDFFTQLCRDVRQTIGIPAFTSFGWFSADHMITSDYVHPDNDGHMAFAANMLSIYNGGNPVRISNSLTLTGTNAIVTIKETFSDASIVRDVAVNIHDVSSSGREAFTVQQGSGLLSNAPFNAYCGEKAPTELFNPDTISTGVYLDRSGEIQNSGIYALSDYIAVEPETTYYVANGTIYPDSRCGAFYNEDKSWHTYAPSSSAASDAKAYTLTTPANVYYMRICYLTENTGSQSVSKQMDTINKAVAVIGTSDAVPTESKKRPTTFRFAVNYNDNGDYNGAGSVI